MELCLDNPREGFADLFATHPSVESRVQALVRYAGGHYIGPLALPKPPSEAQQNETDQSESGQLPPPLSSGPWGSPTNSPSFCHVRAQQQTWGPADPFLAIGGAR